MSANFVDLEEVDFVCTFCSIELPHSVYLSSQAMNRLIGSHFLDKAQLIDNGQSDHCEYGLRELSHLPSSTRQS